MTDRIDVLNHGFVRLVDMMGGDLAVSRSARVSYDAPPREEDGGLINYLMANGHNTPFESTVFTFEVAAPIFVLRQWHRHRTQSYNELSARYRPLPHMYYVPLVEHVTTQSKDNKQMRTDIEHEDAQDIVDSIDAACHASYLVYEELLELGTPRELARGVLPVNMYSHMFTTMNMHNLFGFLRERMHEHAQYEIQVYANAMHKLASEHAPLSFAAFDSQQWLAG